MAMTKEDRERLKDLITSIILFVVMPIVGWWLVYLFEGPMK